MPRSKISLLVRLLTGAGGRQPIASTKTKARRPRDVQRQKVYRWEREHVLPACPAMLTLRDCRELVDAAYRWHEAPAPRTTDWQPPEVTDGRGRRHACGSREVIKLPRWSRTAPIVLHECAHGMSDDGHGPEFVRCYVALLVHFLAMDEAMLRQTLKAGRVRIADRRERAA